MNDQAFYKELGLIFKDVRTEHNMSQQDVADRIGVTRSCYANWEQGIRSIDMVSFYKLCNVFLLDPNDVINKVRRYLYK